VKYLQLNNTGVNAFEMCLPIHLCGLHQFNFELSRLLRRVFYWSGGSRCSGWWAAQLRRTVEPNCECHVTHHRWRSRDEEIRHQQAGQQQQQQQQYCGVELLTCRDARNAWKRIASI